MRFSHNSSLKLTLISSGIQLERSIHPSLLLPWSRMFEESRIHVTSREGTRSNASQFPQGQRLDSCSSAIKRNKTDHENSFYKERMYLLNHLHKKCDFCFILNFTLSVLIVTIPYTEQRYGTCRGWLCCGLCSGAPNDGFLLNALKTLLRLSGVLSDLQKCILSGAIKFVSVRSPQSNLSLFEITRASVLFSPKFQMQF